MNIPIEKFVQILRKGASMDIVYLIKYLKNHDIDELKKKSAKIKATLKAMENKGYISGKGHLTINATALLDFIDDEKATKFIKKTPNVDSFTKWWNTYPSTDTFVYKNKKFRGTRALKMNKEKCKKKFNDILLEGKIKLEQLIDALELELHQKKEDSYKTGVNKLSFMKNAHAYLEQRAYEPFIELLENKEDIIKTNTGGALSI